MKNGKEKYTNILFIYLMPNNKTSADNIINLLFVIFWIKMTIIREKLISYSTFR